ncbi:MAG: nuclear transport factor 2 family protein [Reyranella sp.]
MVRPHLGTSTKDLFMTNPSETARTGVDALSQAVSRYFDLMYDSDVSRFDRVFRSTAQLHGIRHGEMRLLTAQAYRDALARTPSPRSQNAPRHEEILLMDVASDSQALVKVRVRINAILYVDYLSYHRVDGDWLITAKAFHVERENLSS